MGVRQTEQPRVLVQGNKVSKSLAVKTSGDSSSRRNSQSHGTVCWRGPRGSRTYTDPPSWESAPEEPSFLVGSGGSD